MGLVSRYEQVWLTIKAHNTATLVADRRLHPRLVKAVTKRKDLDVVFKLENEPRVAILRNRSSGNTLVFTLQFRLGNLPISEEDI